jgi:hypothetical protein
VPVERRERCRQSLGIRDDGVAVPAERGGQVVARLRVHGHAEHPQALSARLADRHPGILETVPTLVVVGVVRLPVGENEEQAVATRPCGEQPRGG